MIIDSKDAEKEAILCAARLMVVAARTAPKARGQDKIKTLLLLGEEKDRIADEMEKTGTPSPSSKNVRDAGIDIDVSVVDYRTMRREVAPGRTAYGTIFQAANPAGTIELAAWEALGEAIGRRRSLLIVQGEEDLLVLPAILLAPERSFVIYGQPRDGMVVVRVSREKKAEIQEIIDSLVKQDS